MSQPKVYERSSSFSSLQALAPTAPLSGPLVDAEYNNIKTTLDQVLANLAKIQRDDGALANASVGLNQLSTQLSVGFSVPTAWATGLSYISSPASTVFNGGKFYSCLVSHTSGTFATDLAAAKWVLIADLTAIPLVAANQIAVTASGLLTTDVQGSLQALDAGKAASSHTHPSSAISDSTAAGRAFLTAATVAAQKALLSLGAQAYVDNAIVTSIGAQLAFTGVISPAALVANTNDWAPTGWATASRVRLSATSAINITGLLATSDGDIKIIENIGATYTVTIPFESASSAAANRVSGPKDIPVRAGESVVLIYGATSSRWRMVGLGVQPPAKAPTMQLLTSGSSATYTTPAGATYLRLRMVGGGGGGAGSGTASSPGNGGNGGTTSFDLVSALPGAGGLAGNTTVGGGGSAGGSNATASGAWVISPCVGGSGTGGVAGTGGTTGGTGGAGGSSVFGGSGGGGQGSGPNVGFSGGGSTGGGGGGGGSSAAGGGGGGGAGASCEAQIASPAATYTYTIGAGGALGAAGTSGAAGGAGGGGRIEVWEHYN